MISMPGTWKPCLRQGDGDMPVARVAMALHGPHSGFGFRDQRTDERRVAVAAKAEHRQIGEIADHGLELRPAPHTGDVAADRHIRGLHFWRPARPLSAASQMSWTVTPSSRPKRATAFLQIRVDRLLQISFRRGHAGKTAQPASERPRHARRNGIGDEVLSTMRFLHACARCLRQTRSAARRRNRRIGAPARRRQSLAASRSAG